MPYLVALIGPAGSGKTTLANQLSTWRNFIKKPFAANLKSMLRDFLQNQGLDSITIDRMLNGDLKEQSTSALAGCSPRYAMQTLGTEWRDLIHKNLWINAWQREVEGVWAKTDLNIVVDDCRFRHEADRIRSMGGKVIEIRRALSIQVERHISELQYKDVLYDLVVFNTGTPEDMLRELLKLWPELGTTDHAGR